MRKVTDHVFVLFSLQRSIFTKMKVWVQYLYWTQDYPTGPDDPRCSKFEDPGSEPHEPSTSPNITLNYQPLIGAKSKIKSFE